jgi:mannose-6-phosphate isomerase-like protein (cupin superfamily)
MPVQRNSDTTPEVVKPGLTRRVVTLDSIMTVVVDFTGGPWKIADPLHFHPHEQTSYIAEGEIILYSEGETDEHLVAGDVFYIPSGKKHGIKLLTPTARLIDSFSPIREDFLK